MDVKVDAGGILSTNIRLISAGKGNGDSNGSDSGPTTASIACALHE